MLRDPWFRFAAVFAVLAVTCELLYYGVLVGNPAIQGYLFGLARTAARILGLFGVSARVDQGVILTDDFAVEIAHGCDAIQICALYACAVVSFPASLRARLLGLLVGILFLQVFNQVRIVTLLWIGGASPAWFDAAHFTLWPIALIVLTVLSWITWARWATRDVAKREPDRA